MDAATHYLADMLSQMRKLKALAEGAIAQVSDDDLFRCLDREANSMAIIMRHVGGNLRSRFTGFLTSDGEKPDRQRDGEFEMPAGTSRQTIVAGWESGFCELFGALEAMTGADMMRDVYIRGQRHTVIEALNRALQHLSYHVGQIVLLGKHFRGAEWRSLSIPRGQSEQFNRAPGAPRA